MQLTLETTKKVALNTTMFWFSADKTPRYQAGQFVEITLPHDNADDRGEKRWFTLSSSPSEELLAITTKYNQDKSSSFKQALHSMQPGDTLMASDPMGDFVLPKDPSIPLVFIAGGIGVTPMRSMIKWLHDNQEHRTIHLIYAANTIEDVAFRELFNEYGSPAYIVLKEPPKNWDGGSGRLDGNRILEIAPNVDNKLYYLSGPEAMIDSLAAELKQLGLDESRVITDTFPGYQ